MGNKQKIVNEILPIMLANYDGKTFIDIFCGSCSVIENVPNTYRRIANDKQKYLIAMWKSLTNVDILPPLKYCNFYKALHIHKNFLTVHKNLRKTMSLT